MGDNLEAIDLVDDPAAEEAPVPPSPETEPARRTHTKRAKTVALDRLPKRKLEMFYEPVDEELYIDRPKTRGDCQDGERPCPYVSCKYHLYLDVTDRGSLTYNFPNKEVDELKETCALDVADRGGATLNDVGELLQLSRERIRQVENKVLHRLRRHPAALAVLAAGGFDEVRHSPLANAQDDNDATGGGSVTEAVPKTPEQEAAEEFADTVDRIYERTSRERAQGVRPVYAAPEPAEAPEQAPEPVSLAPEPPEPTAAEEVPPATPEEPPPALEEPMPKERPIKVFELTEREKAVVAVYARMAKKLGHKPSPMAIAEELKFKGTRGGISASVCTALRAAERKGVELPFLNDKPPRKAGSEPVPKAPRPRRPKMVEEAPVEHPVEVLPADEPSTAMVALSTPDAFKSVLQLEREKLQKKLAAIDVLLAI